MFHIDKHGKRARCRALVRHCPRGGEVTLMHSTGMQGPARPDAFEAQEAGVYNAFYGDALAQRKLSQERKRQRDAEQTLDSGEFILLGGEHLGL